MILLKHQLNGYTIIILSDPSEIKDHMTIKNKILQPKTSCNDISYWKYISITDLPLINFDLFRIPWNAITINGNYYIKNGTIDRNDTIVYSILHPGHCI